MWVTIGNFSISVFLVMVFIGNLGILHADDQGEKFALGYIFVMITALLLGCFSFWIGM